MIEQYVFDVALQMEIELSNISLVDGLSLGCNDISLVNMSSEGREVGALIFQSDVETLAKGVVAERLEFGVMLALSRLQKFQELSLL